MAMARAKSEQPAERRKNKTEARFEREVLKVMAVTDEASAWWFESFKLRLGYRCWYTPDYLVLGPAGRLTYIEVKGAWIEDDGMAKFKAAAERFPEYSWQMWQWKKADGWKLLHDL